MKKVSKILIVAAVLFCGCSLSNPEIKGRNRMDTHHFEYKGHQYIEFGAVGGYGGVVHDPDCPCFDTTKQLEK